MNITTICNDRKAMAHALAEHAGTAYHTGDRVTFNGEKYICKLAHCVWSPADYPAGWEKQA